MNLIAPLGCTPARLGALPHHLAGLDIDVMLVPLALNAAHDPAGIPKSLWARWKLPQTQKATALNKMKR